MINPGPPPTDRATLNMLQVLRGYAAISVMVGHAVMEWAATYNQIQPFDVQFLLYGVDIFFVISGFIMYRTSIDLFGTNGGFRTFLIKRILRIVPLYWFFTTLMVVTLFLMGDMVRSTEFDVWNVISSYFFIPSERPGGRIAPVLSLGWTLNYEMFFYVIFSFGLFFSRRAGILFIVVTVTLFVIYGWLFHPAWTPLRFWSNSIILEFAAGVLIALVLKRPLGPLVSLALMATGALILFAQAFGLNLGGLRLLNGGLPAILLVAGAAVLPQSLDRLIPFWLSFTGDSSYALYLCHRFVLRAGSIGLISFPLTGTLGLVLYCTAVVCVALALSFAFHKWLERPVLEWGRKRLLG